MKHRLKLKCILAIITGCILLSGCGSDNSKIDLPSQKEMAAAGLEDIAQTDEINDFVLTDYDIAEGEIVYTFTNSQDEKNTLGVTGIKMSAEEYEKMLPASDNLQDTVINDINCKFIDRTVHFVPDGYEVSQRIKDNVAKGTTEIKYGNPSKLDELLPLQRVYWYDENTSVAYTIEAMGQYYTLDNMTEYVRNYVENAE